MTSRDAWVDELVVTLRNIEVGSAPSVPPRPSEGPAPKMTAREWVRFHQAREFDRSWTQAAAAEIALRLLMSRGKK